MLATLPGGQDIIVIGQKSGVGFAMDPDKDGDVVWQYRAGQGGVLGGIEWGSAVDAEQCLLRRLRHHPSATRRAARGESRDGRAGVVCAAASADLRQPDAGATPPNRRR